MLEEAVRYARAQDLLYPGMHVLVACSGGPDSLALLDMLLQFRRRFDLVLTVAHFEHGIRGASSAEDARFVDVFCREREVPCFIGHGDVPAFAKAQGKSVELAARELRYAFLWQTLERCGADVLATAHHALDQQVDCTDRSVALDLKGFATPVGTPASVSATITCRVETLGLPGLPSVTVSATMRSPIDSYRGRQP